MSTENLSESEKIYFSSFIAEESEHQINRDAGLIYRYTRQLSHSHANERVHGSFLWGRVLLGSSSGVPYSYAHFYRAEKPGGVFVFQGQQDSPMNYGVELLEVEPASGRVRDGLMIGMADVGDGIRIFKLVAEDNGEGKLKTVATSQEERDILKRALVVQHDPGGYDGGPIPVE